MYFIWYIWIKFLVFVFLIIFVNTRKNLLMCLIALEGVILTLGLMLFFNCSISELFILFVLFTFGACEARLGLSCLVIIIRSFGADNFCNISLIKC